jgi:hypothetical protein
LIFIDSILFMSIIFSQPFFSIRIDLRSIVKFPSFQYKKLLTKNRITNKIINDSEIIPISLSYFIKESSESIDVYFNKI